METVGFIGLGNMGNGMSLNIQKSGYPMVVYDLREEMTKPLLENGAALGSSPADVAARCNVVFTSLPDVVFCDHSGDEVKRALEVWHETGATLFVADAPQARVPRGRVDGVTRRER